MKKAIILAAGKGTRMESELPKVVHKICGREMINHVLDTTKKIGIDEDIVVVGYRDDIVRACVDRNVKYVLQKEQLGTGHAVMMAKEYINSDDKVIVLYGDMPLFTKETLEEMFRYNEKTNADLTIITTIFDETCKYGRIIKDDNGNVKKVTEYKDATDEERKMTEVNCGPVVYKGETLLFALNQMTNDNAQNEYYLTDAVEIAYNAGKKVNSFIINDNKEAFGANTQEELKKAEEIFKEMNNI